MVGEITLRPITAEDEEFLLELYASTRPEVEMLDWDAATGDAFIKMQFEMQTRAFQMQYPTAEHSVIMLGGERVGRLIIDRREDADNLTDIAVLPAFRGHGIASMVIRRLQDEAAAEGRSITLYVDRANENARQLYHTLGFQMIGETKIGVHMRWQSNQT